MGKVAENCMSDQTIDTFISRLERITYRDESGVELWYPRELQEALEYSWLRSFEEVIDNFKILKFLARALVSTFLLFSRRWKNRASCATTKKIGC
jgi:hypothetical protein